MTPTTLQQRKAWVLARRQHWVVTYAQLRGLGFSREAIRHRVRTGRLRPVWPGVFAVGARDLAPEGRWMAAVLTCGEGACLYGESAGQHLGIRPHRRGPVHINVPYARNPKPRKGIKLHRRDLGLSEIVIHKAIPTTIPLIALIDLARGLGPNDLERAIGEADKLNLIDPETLREELGHARRRPGIKRLKQILDRHTFVLTHTELERRFLAIVRRAGLPLPDGQRGHGPHRVDFWFPQLDLVVETDGLTYHRTAAQQTEDLRRDQAHAVAGRRTLRFSHAQIRYEPRYVEQTLVAVMTSLGGLP